MMSQTAHNQLHAISGGKTQVPIGELADTVSSAMESGWRLGLMTARRPESADSGFLLVTLLIDTCSARTLICETPIAEAPDGGACYPSITPRIPQAHWFERAISDLFGIRPIGHPRFKSLILHEAWPAGFHPLADASLTTDGEYTPKSYSFMTVKGDGVYEIPVGPIHAGIIEPGHFRFSCLGEVIENLEIRLGYQHRGIEEQMTRIPWRSARFLAESAGSDTSVGNALAHAMAMEQLLAVDAPPAAVRLRAVALEIERVASHIGDIGGICSDIGYAGGASIFARLRGQALGLGERLTGTRFQTAYVMPGGVARDLKDDLREEILSETVDVAMRFVEARPLIADNSSALERMQGIGIVRPSLAKDFGLVGPSGRASGSSYDVRTRPGQPPYDELSWDVASERTGDVYSRLLVKLTEAMSSLDMIRRLLSVSYEGQEIRRALPNELPASGTGMGIVEAWRGEMIHLVFTDENRHITRYCIKDPSFNNWTGLSIASRNQLVGDFPLCNKSFGLSYSGNDL